MAAATTRATTAVRAIILAALACAAALAFALGPLATGAAAASDANPAGASDPAAASDAGPSIDPDADLVLFWGDGCPNCAKEKEWLAEVQEQYPDLTITLYEVWNDEANQELFKATGDRLGFEAGSVPTTIIGERVWIGWTTSIEQDMAGALALVSQGKLPPAGVFGTAGAGTCDDASLTCSLEEPDVTVDVPLVGEVSLGGKSLLVSTLIIGFVDGINPCSLWVLSVLLTIVLRTSSRPRVIAIGTTFLLVTAAMYGLYMAAFYSALTVVGFLGFIQIAVAVIAGVFGAVSVKDYFAFKQGLSFTISDKAKPGIYQRMRDAAGHHSLIPALGATIALAVGVSLMETPCTAGFPVLWTGMLHANNVGAAETGFLFVAYMVPFLLDEFAIFAIAVVTMRATKFQQHQGELLKLFAGVTMLVLAAVMAIEPTLMESPVAALLLFAGAFALAWITHVVATRLRARHLARKEADAGAGGAAPGEATPSAEEASQP